MRRTVGEFSQDDEGDWVAHLSCLHGQHIRHQPPFQDRPWVLNAAGRAARIGSDIDCPLCNRAELPEGLCLARTAGPFDAHSLPAGLRRSHRVGEGTWGVLRVIEGSLVLSMATEPPVTRQLGAGDNQPLPPGVPHALTLDGPVRLAVDFLVPEDRGGEPTGPGPPERADGRRAALGDLDHNGLRRAQQETEQSPRRPYGPAARLLFGLLDAIYGRRRTLSKFKVLELVARVPYQSWEQVAYIAMTHTYERTGLARRIYDRVAEARAQQDNEQWHLLILEERILDEGLHEGWVQFRVIPQLLAFAYYQLSWLLYVLRPAWSYRLNADFEDHAEHEYMAFVAEHPEWETQPFQSDFAADYAILATVADLFRQIGYDERVHKQESLAAMREPRFR